MIKRNTWLWPLGFLCLTALIWQCKDQKEIKDVSQQVESAEKVEVKKVPKVIEDLTTFAEIVYSDTVDLTNLISFKEIDSSGNLHIVDMSRSASRFKQMMTNKRGSSYPIVDINDTDHVVLMVQGRGYGGPIWAKLLIDTKEMLIAKLEIQHSAESEGYGASITMSSFESQFAGKKLEVNGANFGLNQSGSVLIDGVHQVDGISGATQTGMAAVDMINKGLDQCMEQLVK